MKTLRKFPSWLPRKLEAVVFALFALLWSASLGGCNPASDEIAVRYGGPDVQDTLVAKYGAPPPADTMKAWYGAPTPVDTMKAWYGAPTPIDTAVVKPPDPIVVRYGVYMPSDTTQPTDRFLEYGSPMPADTVIAKYGVRVEPGPTDPFHPDAPLTGTDDA